MSDINQRDKSGETMLMKAAEMGHANKVISFLISGADTRLTDKNGVNAKQKALQRGHETVSKIIQAAEDTTPPVSRDKLIRIKEKGSMNDALVAQTSQKRNMNPVGGSMKLMTGEKKLLESDKGQLVLTTHRVRYDVGSTGKRKIVSIMLDELCSCELNHSSYTLLLLLAALSLLLGIVADGGYELLIIGTIACIVFAAAFFLSRKQVLSLASAGAVINVETKGMKPEMIKEFIDAVEIAKFEKRN